VFTACLKSLTPMKHNLPKIKTYAISIENWLKLLREKGGS